MQAKMCLSINIILIFLSCSKFGLGQHIPRKTSESGHEDCYIKMPLVNSEFMPIPYEGNFAQKVVLMFYETVRELKPHPIKPKVIHPDKNGYLFFKHNTSYKLTCSEREFVSPTRYPISDVMIKCVNGQFLYEGKAYEFNKFKCDGVPRPSLVSTEKKCQGEEYHEVHKVGFESQHIFLNLYRICFNPWHKNTLYAWYFVNPPFYEYNQISKVKPSFFWSREFDTTNPNEVYGNQTITLEKTFKKDGLLDVYKEKKPKKPFIVPGQLVSEHEFIYFAEQYSTFYYENSAPQWSTFNSEVWNDVQKSFRRNMIKSTSRHLIVTGTLLASSLNSTSYNEDDDLYLIIPNSFAVPEYFWKMDYDLDKKNGTVFVGVNNPYKKIDPSAHICDTIPCPGRALSSIDKRSKLFYCCTKKSFEKVYGEIDPVVYIEF